MAVVREFLAEQTDDSSENGGDAQVSKPPRAAREWLTQEQVRAWLVAILSRAEPLRLTEVDAVLAGGKVRHVLIFTPNCGCKGHRLPVG